MPSPPRSDSGCAEGSPLILVDHLRRGYRVGNGMAWALDGVSLEIHGGEFVAVMGPSGSGKTTLMNILGCLDAPTEGQYYLNGLDTGALHSDALADLRSETIGFIFQSFNLLPSMTALENVELPLLYRRRGYATRLRGLALLDRLGLADHADHKPAQLSGGQQQRVAIARALINEPLLLLADEPTGSLDSRSGREILAILQELNAEGLTVVLVTHDAQVAALAERILAFHDGRIVADERRRAADAEIAGRAVPSC